jgi:glycosidase
MRVESSLKDITITIPEKVYPSPADWRDQIFYLLIIDRFSDGNEEKRPLYEPSMEGNGLTPDHGASWRRAGLEWQGGTFKGIESKLFYLKELGITTLWLSPIFRQRADWTSIDRDYTFTAYHGYAIQNFLDVDPHFGTREDLKRLVEKAHQMGMYVILDIIHNHTGNNWYYEGYDGARNLLHYPDYASGGYPFGGWRTLKGKGLHGPITSEEDAIWPREFQDPDLYEKKGIIKNWDTDPEFREGDFFELKKLNHNRKEVLEALIKVFRFWINYTDCDGFRIDAVKHVGVENSRIFCNAVREYAELIGKKNFLLLGEVAGSEFIAAQYLQDTTQHGLTTVLDINGPPRALERVVKGFADPSDLFQYYTRKSNLPMASHREMGKYHVSVLDDHDQVWRYPEEGKARFCANNPFPEQVVTAAGFLVTSMGIPAYYYGTEQGFDGQGGPPYADRWIRESMFGGAFGAKRTKGVHFFDTKNPIYQKLSRINKIRATEPALRYGRQYFRPFSDNGIDFWWPSRKDMIAWSRILAGEEMVIALNTDAHNPKREWVLIEGELHQAGARLEYFFSSNGEEGKSTEVYQKGDYKCIQIEIPPMGMVILKRKE